MSIRASNIVPCDPIGENNWTSNRDMKLASCVVPTNNKTEMKNRSTSITKKQIGKSYCSFYRAIFGYRNTFFFLMLQVPFLQNTNFYHSSTPAQSFRIHHLDRIQTDHLFIIHIHEAIQQIHHKLCQVINVRTNIV